MRDMKVAGRLFFSAVSYPDFAVDGGQTYYYVATSVDSSNRESVYSNEAKAVVPSP
jgi:hypothetical protein